MLTNKKCQFLTLSVISLFSNQKLFLVKLKKKKKNVMEMWFGFICMYVLDEMSQTVFQKLWYKELWKKKQSD